LKVLLDECVNSHLAAHMVGVEVATVAAKGWGGIANGKLLALAAVEFSVFVTVDRNLSFQQHLPTYDIAVVLVTANSNRIDDLLPLVPKLFESIPRAQ
jgi:hypothetical protein